MARIAEDAARRHAGTCAGRAQNGSGWMARRISRGLLRPSLLLKANALPGRTAFTQNEIVFWPAESAFATAALTSICRYCCTWLR
ncbi:hypothetical protein D3C71_1689580 [compost metagenome]